MTFDGTSALRYVNRRDRQGREKSFSDTVEIESLRALDGPTPLPDNAGMSTYTHLVPIGCNCETAFAMQRYDCPMLANPFRWALSASFEFAKVIENDFKGLFERENLEVQGCGVRDNAAAIFFHSDIFKSGVFDEAVYEIERKKSDALIERWRSAFRSSESRLLVAHKMSYFVEDMDAAAVGETLLRALEKHAPAADRGAAFDLLILTRKEDPSRPHDRSHARGSLLYRELEFSPMENAWDLDFRGWDEVMLPLGLHRAPRPQLEKLYGSGGFRCDPFYFEKG